MYGKKRDKIQEDAPFQTNLMDAAPSQECPLFPRVRYVIILKNIRWNCEEGLGKYTRTIFQKPHFPGFVQGVVCINIY